MMLLANYSINLTPPHKNNKHTLILSIMTNLIAKQNKKSICKDCVTTPPIVANQYIEVSWWNMRRKQLEFLGTISEYLEFKDISLKPITHPISTNTSLCSANGYRFKFRLASRYITFDVYQRLLPDAAIEAITIFLTILGDKAQIRGYRNKQINF